MTAAQARSAAFEEAAKIADSYRTNGLFGARDARGFDIVATRIAAAIRAAKDHK